MQTLLDSTFAHNTYSTNTARKHLRPAFTWRRSDHADRNVELFHQMTQYHYTLLDCISTIQSLLSYSCTWFCNKLPRLYLHFAKFQILLMYTTIVTVMSMFNKLYIWDHNSFFFFLLLECLLINIDEIHKPLKYNKANFHFLDNNHLIEWTFIELYINDIFPESRVAEYIPPRPLFPRRTNGAQRAVEDFHQQVANIGNMVLEEFRYIFNKSLCFVFVFSGMQLLSDHMGVF